MSTGYRRYAAFDEHTPAGRLARYRVEKWRNITKCAEYIFILGLCDLVIGWIILHPDTGWGLCTSLLIVPVMLLGGDAYELVRDWLENWYFCPRYDRASQPRPQFEVREGFGPGRYVLYLIVAPLLNTALLWLLRHYGQIHPLPNLNLYELGICLSLASTVLLIYGQPLTLGEALKPFKRLPGPDINANNRTNQRTDRNFGPR
jgi:hypothetical protein